MSNHDDGRALGIFAMDRLKVLCVDDEPHVLEGLSLHLRRIYDVERATSAHEGLRLIEAQGPFVIVLSDMRMPGMDGAAFLSRVREKAPDTTRMLLTGYADVQAAISAVNEGQIFRFLTKPCPPDQLLAAFQAAARQYQLVTSERILLEQTLHGALRALTDVLALTSPLAFGRTNRIRQHVSAIAEEMRLDNRWQVEVAAMLSQLGTITIPEDLISKHYMGEALSPDEKAIISRIPAVTDSFLARIPRLEAVREILTKHQLPFSRLSLGSGTGRDNAVVAASILRIATAYDELHLRGLASHIALDTMRSREGAYDPTILNLFARILGATAESQVIREISLRELAVGMVLAEDMRTQKGLLIVTHGFEVTPSFLEKTRNYEAGYISEPLRVIVKQARAS